MEQEFIESGGEKIYFRIQRKNIKNMNLRVGRDKEVTISIPKKMPTEKAKEFIKQKANWIKKHQKNYETNAKPKESKTFENGDILYLLGTQYKLQLIKDYKNNIEINNQNIEIHIKEKYVGNKKYIKKEYEKWLKKYAINIIENLVLKYQKELKKYNIKIPEIEIKQMKSKWGSCITSKNKVTFNLSLIKTPMYCIEYVVLHELSHFKHPNHSKNFYNFVTIFMPDWKERKKILDKEFTVIV